MKRSHVRLISGVLPTTAATSRPQADARHTPTQFCVCCLWCPCACLFYHDPYLVVSQFTNTDVVEPFWANVAPNPADIFAFPNLFDEGDLASYSYVFIAISNVYFLLNSAFRVLYVIPHISFRNTIPYFIRWLHSAFHIPHFNPTPPRIVFNMADIVWHTVFISEKLFRFTDCKRNCAVFD